MLGESHRQGFTHLRERSGFWHENGGFRVKIWGLVRKYPRRQVNTQSRRHGLNNLRGCSPHCNISNKVNLNVPDAPNHFHISTTRVHFAAQKQTAQQIEDDQTKRQDRTEHKDVYQQQYQRGKRASPLRHNE